MTKEKTEVKPVPLLKKGLDLLKYSNETSSFSENQWFSVKNRKKPFSFPYLLHRKTRFTSSNKTLERKTKSKRKLSCFLMSLLVWPGETRDVHRGWESAAAFVKRSYRAAMVYKNKLPPRYRDDFFKNLPWPCRHRHGGRGAAAVAAAPPWTSLSHMYTKRTSCSRASINVFI